MPEYALPWGWGSGREDDSGARESAGGGRGNGVGPVCIGVVEGMLRAQLARSYLEDAGFTVFLDGEAVADVYGLIGGPLGVVRVLVPAAQAEEATLVWADLDLQ